MTKEERTEIIKRILKYYLITRGVLLIFIILFEIFLPYSPSEYNSVLTLFDNEHYLMIATFGYIQDRLYAFFPFVPLLIRYLGKAGFIILNQLLVILSGYLIYLIDKKIFKNENNYGPVIFWLVSPISVFTCMYYTEGLFVFLTLMAYYLYKNKKNYFLLGSIIGLCVFTRSVGSVLFFSIFILMMINVFKNKEKFKNVIITYIPATIISCIYPTYLYFKMGDPFHFVTVQSYWLKVPTNIFIVFIDAFKYMDWKYNLFYDFNYLLTLGLFICLFYIMIKKRKEKKYYEIFLYLILSLIYITSVIKGMRDPLASYYRYIFGCFSIYFMLERKNYVYLILIILSIVITLFFLAGIYFA